jgi:hypothetical protein
MADEEPNIWQRARRWLGFTPEPQIIELGIATEQDSALPVSATVSEALPPKVLAGPRQVITASGELKAGAASLSGTATVSAAGDVGEREVETPARNTDGNVFVPGDGGLDAATAAILRAAAAGTRMPYLEGGATEPVNVEVAASTAHLEIKGYPADVTVSQGPGGRRLTDEQLSRDIRQAFRGDKVAIAEWINVAHDTTEALQKTLEIAGINNEATAAKAREFLVYQTLALDNIQQLVADGATEDAARTWQEWLARAAQTALSVVGEPGIIRGIVTTAALCTLGYFGAFAPASAGLIAAGMMRLDKTTLELLATMHGKKAD